MRYRSALVLVLGLALLPAQAQGQGVVVPPGNSEATQYFESVPNVKGNSSPDTQRALTEGVLTPAQIEALQKKGPDGAAAAQSAVATGPPTPGGEPDKEGLGTFFPLILIASAIAALALALRRWRPLRPSG